MNYIAGSDRGEALLLPEVLDDYIAAENPVRFIDAFVNNRAATAFAAVDRPTATHPHHEHPALKLDIERHVNHTRFGPKSLKALPSRHVRIGVCLASFSKE